MKEYQIVENGLTTSTPISLSLSTYTATNDTLPFRESPINGLLLDQVFQFLGRRFKRSFSLPHTPFFGGFRVLMAPRDWMEGCSETALCLLATSSARIVPTGHHFTIALLCLEDLRSVQMALKDQGLNRSVRASRSRKSSNTESWLFEPLQIYLLPPSCVSGSSVV